jgi:hypothetical protein
VGVVSLLYLLACALQYRYINNKKSVSAVTACGLHSQQFTAGFAGDRQTAITADDQRNALASALKA